MGSQRVGGDWETFTFPDGSAGKESGCIAGDIGNTGSILWSGRSSTGGNGNPFQSSCLGNSMHTRAWQATVHRVPKRVRHALATKQQHAPSDHEPEERQKN